MLLTDFYGGEGIWTLRFRGVWVWRNEGQKLAMTTRVVMMTKRSVSHLWPWFWKMPTQATQWRFLMKPHSPQMSKKNGVKFTWTPFFLLICYAPPQAGRDVRTQWANPGKNGISEEDISLSSSYLQHLRAALEGARRHSNWLITKDIRLSPLRAKSPKLQHLGLSITYF